MQKKELQKAGLDLEQDSAHRFFCKIRGDNPLLFLLQVRKQDLIDFFDELLQDHFVIC